MHPILKLLGLAQCAGKLVSGEDFCVAGTQNGSVKLLFLASDAGVNTTKKITDKAAFYKVDVIKDYSSMELSNAIGKTNRMVLGITDIGFAKKMKEIR